eukprot:TRINITY_DN42896_c0_g1_i1.p1 TRINITY_DN42896_c0_g1~~TRINITY_DN42896_c0_g1_i1.p1  ORF type:complete len:320 (+),score=186.94 TRINITY_DN42896_c0_g1_i1:48-962(+)
MPLTKEQVQEAFDLFDNDMSGFITADEIKLVFKGIGIKVDEDEILEQFDEDGDNKISFEEFWKLMQKQQKEAEGPREILAAFQAFNPSGSGEISKDDLREVAMSICETVTEQDINEIWQYCADNDVDDEGTSHFSFTAWRSVMDQMYDRRTSRGNDEIYNAENIKKGLPDREDAIWEELEQEEMETREDRIEQREQKAMEKLTRKSNIQAAQLARERHDEEEANKPETGPTKTSKWRQTQSMQDVVKEQMAKRKEVLQKQLEQERVAAEQEAEEEARVLAKIEEKRKRVQAKEAEGQPVEEEEA